jgi:hypothetical protein
MCWESLAAGLSGSCQAGKGLIKKCIHAGYAAYRVPTSVLMPRTCSGRGTPLPQLMLRAVKEELLLVC